MPQLRFDGHERLLDDLIGDLHVQRLKHTLEFCLTVIGIGYVVNSARNDWHIQNLEDCVFGMVFHKYIELSSQYLTNKMVDNAETANTENTMETFDESLDVWSDHVPEIGHAILEASRLY